MTAALETSIDSSRLVFVAGLHRSGTTPLARLLATHPEISGFVETGVKEDEGQHLQDVYPSARQYGGAGRFAFDERSHLTERSPLATVENAQRMLDQWAGHWDLDRRLLLEKSPPNLVMTRFLQQLYPEARFVVVVRHPVVVALSTQKWAGPLAGLPPLLEHWVRAHETFLADAAKLRNVHVVRYEQLVSDPTGTLAGVAEFLGLCEPIAADSLDGSRSDRYRTAWGELTGSKLTRHAASDRADAGAVRGPDRPVRVRLRRPRGVGGLPGAAPFRKHAFPPAPGPVRRRHAAQRLDADRPDAPPAARSHRRW